MGIRVPFLFLVVLFFHTAIQAQQDNTSPNVILILADDMGIGDVFVENGYVTGLVGKWHFGIGEDFRKHQSGKLKVIINNQN